MPRTKQSARRGRGRGSGGPRARGRGERVAGEQRGDAAAAAAADQQDAARSDADDSLPSLPPLEPQFDHEALEPLDDHEPLSPDESQSDQESLPPLEPQIPREPTPPAAADPVDWTIEAEPESKHDGSPRTKTEQDSSRAHAAAAAAAPSLEVLERCLEGGHLYYLIRRRGRSGVLQPQIWHSATPGDPEADRACFATFEAQQAIKVAQWQLKETLRLQSFVDHTEAPTAEYMAVIRQRTHAHIPSFATSTPEAATSAAASSYAFAAEPMDAPTTPLAPLSPPRPAAAVLKIAASPLRSPKREILPSPAALPSQSARPPADNEEEGDEDSESDVVMEDAPPTIAALSPSHPSPTLAGALLRHSPPPPSSSYDREEKKSAVRAPPREPPSTLMTDLGDGSPAAATSSSSLPSDMPSLDSSAAPTSAALVATSSIVAAAAAPSAEMDDTIEDIPGPCCSVCDSSAQPPGWVESPLLPSDASALLSCHKCSVVVHAACYGVSVMPLEGSWWWCAVCDGSGFQRHELPGGLASQETHGRDEERREAKRAGKAALEHWEADVRPAQQHLFDARDMRCLVCTHTGVLGALMPLNFEFNYIHVRCARYLPPRMLLQWPTPPFRWFFITKELTSKETLGKRGHIVCALCKVERFSYCTPCAYTGCQRRMHPTCAKKRGCRFQAIPPTYSGAWTHEIYCPKHSGDPDETEDDAAPPDEEDLPKPKRRITKPKPKAVKPRAAAATTKAESSLKDESIMSMSESASDADDDALPLSQQRHSHRKIRRLVDDSEDEDDAMSDGPSAQPAPVASATASSRKRKQIVIITSSDSDDDDSDGDLIDTKKIKPKREEAKPAKPAKKPSTPPPQAKRRRLKKSASSSDSDDAAELVERGEEEYSVSEESSDASDDGSDDEDSEPEQEEEEMGVQDSDRDFSSDHTHSGDEEDDDPPLPGQFVPAYPGQTQQDAARVRKAEKKAARKQNNLAIEEKRLAKKADMAKLRDSLANPRNAGPILVRHIAAADTTTKRQEVITLIFGVCITGVKGVHSITRVTRAVFWLHAQGLTTSPTPLQRLIDWLKQEPLFNVNLSSDQVARAPAADPVHAFVAMMHALVLGLLISYKLWGQPLLTSVKRMQSAVTPYHGLSPAQHDALLALHKAQEASLREVLRRCASFEGDSNKQMRANANKLINHLNGMGDKHKLALRSDEIAAMQQLQPPGAVSQAVAAATVKHADTSSNSMVGLAAQLLLKTRGKEHMKQIRKRLLRDSKWSKTAGFARIVKQGVIPPIPTVVANELAQLPLLPPANFTNKAVRKEWKNQQRARRAEIMSRAQLTRDQRAATLIDRDGAELTAKRGSAAQRYAEKKAKEAGAVTRERHQVYSSAIHERPVRAAATAAAALTRSALALVPTAASSATPRAVSAASGPSASAIISSSTPKAPKPVAARPAAASTPPVPAIVPSLPPVAQLYRPRAPAPAHLGAEGRHKWRQQERLNESKFLLTLEAAKSAQWHREKKAYKAWKALPEEAKLYPAPASLKTAAAAPVSIPAAPKPVVKSAFTAPNRLATVTSVHRPLVPPLIPMSARPSGPQPSAVSLAFPRDFPASASGSAISPASNGSVQTQAFLSQSAYGAPVPLTSTYTSAASLIAPAAAVDPFDLSFPPTASAAPFAYDRAWQYPRPGAARLDDDMPPLER